MSKTALATTLALTLGLAMSAPTLAQAPAAAPAPAAPTGPSKDPAAAPAGVYNLDPAHNSVIARVGHGGGTSFSTMRFGASGTLNWDPANPANVKANITIDAKPHYDPIVYRTAPEAQQFLNAAQFPNITFVSTGVTRTGPTKADIAGNLTMLGVTKPVVLHIDLVGVGKNGAGKAILGFTGTTQIKRTDWGMNALANNVGVDIAIQLDGEFIQS